MVFRLGKHGVRALYSFPLVPSLFHYCLLLQLLLLSWLEENFHSFFFSFFIQKMGEEKMRGNCVVAIVVKDVRFETFVDVLHEMSE